MFKACGFFFGLMVAFALPGAIGHVMTGWPEPWWVTQAMNAAFLCLGLSFVAGLADMVSARLRGEQIF